MLNHEERLAIEQKALEQAMRAAALAKADPLPILPLVSAWPFSLTQDDYHFLADNKISPA